jgi:phytoene dehydrogenase-like protein
MDKVECVVIGAGVIGLAVARQLAQAGREVIILEAAEGIGTVTSSRNSEVIHAGIYYPAGSLMARMCVSGRRELYQYCAEHGIPHRNCGKLIVATTAKETAKLQSIQAHAEANGVLDLKTLSGADARAMEPALNCDAALLRCYRLPPASSTAMPTCWRCAATPRMPVLRLPFIRRCCAPERAPAESNSTPAARRRRASNAGCWSMPRGLALPRSRAISTACRSS